MNEEQWETLSLIVGDAYRKSLTRWRYTRMLVIVYLLNIFDAFSTVFLVSNGYAYEANPIMAYVMSFGFTTFLAFKMLFFIPVLFLLRRGIDTNIGKVCIWISLIVYSILVAYHVYVLHVITK